MLPTGESPDSSEPSSDALSPDELWEAWDVLTFEDRLEGFRMLPREEAEDFFLGLSGRDQLAILESIPPGQRRAWIRLLPPDDAADLLQSAEGEERSQLLGLLDEATRHEVSALMAYEEDAAGGLMSPRFARARPGMRVDEALTYLRKQARETLETIYYVYVVGHDQKLVGVVSLRELFQARPEQTVDEIMQRDLVTARDDMDQEALSSLFRDHGFIAVPIVDPEGRMKGIVTVDDIVEVAYEEATEDIQKIGGMAALEEPYLQIGILGMLRKRGGWLAVLFVGEMLTASAMSYFEDEIARAVVLALFVPLIISSGGNSGSQATTLVIRALALGEVRLRDWFRVIRRELATGLGLGLVLAVLGFLRVVLWEKVFHTYGEHYLGVAATVSLSLVGVVMFGTIAGSMLPFILRRLGLDPASASAPFVATLVDVSGVVIYFGLASLLLAGTLL